jgi:hypothetical protein
MRRLLQSRWLLRRLWLRANQAPHVLTSTPPSVYDYRLRGKDGDSYGAQAKAA